MTRSQSRVAHLIAAAEEIAIFAPFAVTLSLDSLLDPERTLLEPISAKISLWAPRITTASPGDSEPLPHAIDPKPETVFVRTTSPLGCITLDLYREEPRQIRLKERGKSKPGRIR